MREQEATKQRASPLQRHMSFVGKPIDALRRSKSGRVKPSVGAEDGEGRENHRRDWETPSGATTSFRDTAKESVRRAKAASPPSRSAFWDWWVIDPRHSTRLGTWDLITVFALVFVAIVTPFEIAFLPSPTSSSDLIERFASVGWLWIVNRCVV